MRISDWISDVFSSDLEFPERAAQRVQPAGGHVDRAEAAVRGVVDGAELLRPPAGQRLRLVAAGEERELVRVALADRRQPVGGDLQGFFPLDLAELALEIGRAHV